MKRVCGFVLAVSFVAVGAFGQLADQTDNNAPILPGPDGVGVCPIVINGVLGSGSPNWPSTSGTQTGRLNRNGVASTCAAPKVCDIFLTDPGRAFDAYEFTNSTGAPACVSTMLEVITQADCNLQVNTYLNTYDPANICTGYLADPGSSSGIPPNPVPPFEGTVPPGETMIAVVHTTNPGEIGCEYTLTFSGDCIPVELQSFDVE